MVAKGAAKGSKMVDPRQVIFGAALRLQRQRRGWTQEHLALLVRYDDATMISQLERGERAPSLLKAVEIAELFGTTVNAMCGYPVAGALTHNHAGAVAMNTGFVMFGGIDFSELLALVETVLGRGQGEGRRE